MPIAALKPIRGKEVIFFRAMLRAIADVENEHLIRRLMLANHETREVVVRRCRSIYNANALAWEI